MSLYTKQNWYCNNCGHRMFSVPHKAIIAGSASHNSVCSHECSREMQWKLILSTLGKEYYPQPEEKK